MKTQVKWAQQGNNKEVCKRAGNMMFPMDKLSAKECERLFLDSWQYEEGKGDKDMD